MTSPERYDVPLAQLVATARIRPKDQVEEQAKLQVPARDDYAAEATAMGLPQPPA